MVSTARTSIPSWLWPVLAVLAAAFLVLSSLLGRVVEVNCGADARLPTKCSVVSHGLFFDWSSATFDTLEVKNAYVGVSQGPEALSPNRMAANVTSLVVAWKDEQKPSIDVADYSYFGDSDAVDGAAEKIRALIKDPQSGPVHASFGEHWTAIVCWLALTLVVGGWLIKAYRKK